MPLVFGCVAPHGSIIPGLPDAERFARTTAAMEELGRRCAETQPETLVVVTPHGVRVDAAMAISQSERAAGDLHDESPSEPIRVELDVDRDLARAISARAVEGGIPVAAVHYGATTGAGNCYPLDWGAVIPLWFLGARRAEPPRVVIIVPSRALSLPTLAAFGRALAAVAEATERRVALVASADQAHAHAEDGPYGFDPAAAAFDEWIQAAVRDGDLQRLMQPDAEQVRRACPDALWQMVVLAGALQVVPMRGELLSYEAPTYFGMLVASYERESA